MSLRAETGKLGNEAFSSPGLQYPDAVWGRGEAVTSASSQAFVGGPPLLLHLGLSAQRPAAPHLPSLCTFHFLAKAGEGLLPGQFFPWDALCVQMRFSVCTTFLWQGVWVGVDAWYSFTDVRREFTFEAGVYSTSPARAHLQLGHASPQPLHVIRSLTE